MPTDVLLQHFAAQTKIGPSDRLPELIRSHLPGLALQVLPVPPRQIPFQAGYIYYDIRREGALWEHIARYGGMAMHTAGEFPGWRQNCGECAINDRQYPDAASGRHDVLLSTTPEHKDSEYETPVHTSQRTELNVIVEDGPDSKLRLAEISAAANPLLAAARPLLCALAAMPAKLDAAPQSLTVICWYARCICTRHYAIRRTCGASTYWRYVTACVRRLMKPPITQHGDGAASGPEKACW